MLTVEQAAQALNVPVGEVYRLLQRGEIPAIRLGRYWRIPPDIVGRLIREGGGGGGDEKA